MLTRSIAASLIAVSAITTAVVSEADGEGIFSANQVPVSDYNLNAATNTLTFNADDMRLIRGDYELVLPKGLHIVPGDRIALSYNMDQMKISSLRAIHINGDTAWEQRMSLHPKLNPLPSPS